MGDFCKKIFPDSKSSQVKSCPKSTFLGLCEVGYIPNVPNGKYTRFMKNKLYAINGISLLKSNSAMTEYELWKKVIDTPDKKYNHQMDIVKSLWDNKMIKK